MQQWPKCWYKYMKCWSSIIFPKQLHIFEQGLLMPSNELKIILKYTLRQQIKNFASKLINNN